MTIHFVRRKETLTVLMILFAGLVRLHASTVGDLVREVAGGHEEEWQRSFAFELELATADAHISPVAYQAVLQAFAGNQTVGSPVEAARQVFSLCLNADRSLRRGVPPAQVAFEARRSVGLAQRSGGESGVRESAQYRIRRQLAGMGSDISGVVEQRPGPQNGGGAGTPIGPAYSGETTQSGGHTASGGGGSGKASK